MKIKYLPFPEWFWNSKTFQLETDNTHSNYKSVKERVFDYDNFPDVVAPINKFVGHGEYRYDLMKAQEGDSVRNDPSERLGYTHFPRFNGLIAGQNNAFFNTYPTSKQVKFANEAGNVFDDTLTMSPQQEDIVWINGEQGIGYAIGDAEAARIKTMIDGLKVAKPNSKYGIYSLQVFPIWQLFYEINGDFTKADVLCTYLDNPPTSIHEKCGMDYLMEDLYSLGTNNTQIFTAIGIFTKQLARKKYQLTGKSVYNDVRYLIWSHTENLGFNFNYIKNTGEMISCGELDGLSKAPANPEHNYNLALHGLTSANGIFSFIDRFTAFGTVNIDGVNRDIEKENVDGTDAGTGVTLAGQFYKIAPAIIPAISANMLVSIALWQTSFVRDIIDATLYEWFTPDFIYNGNTRTGKYKQIPYNIFYKEPTFELKFNNDKSKALLYAVNLSDVVPTTPIHVQVKITDTLTIPVVLKGNKAELITIELT
jgi:hypothetical protein